MGAMETVTMIPPTMPADPPVDEAAGAALVVALRNPKVGVTDRRILNQQSMIRIVQGMIDNGDSVPADYMNAICGYVTAWHGLHAKCAQSTLKREDGTTYAELAFWPE